MQKRPSAAIMGDDWFGHRNPLTFRPEGDREEFTRWDWALLNAFQTLEDYTDQKSGLPQWEIDGEGVEVDALKKINKFEASVALATKGSEKHPYKPRPGEYFVPEMWSRKKDEDGNEVFPTFREWVERSIAEDND